MPKAETQFKKGEAPGRPPGATNKVNRLVKDVFAEVFNHLQTDPKAIKEKADLKTWGRQHPKDFYAIASKLIPVQMQHEGELTHRLIIEDTANCQPLNDESNPGISGQSESL